MIFGECPYEDCSNPFALAVDITPRFQKHVCEKCSRTIWTYHSRFDPKSYTEEGFQEEYDVDEEAKHITKKTNL